MLRDDINTAVKEAMKAKDERKLGAAALVIELDRLLALLDHLLQHGEQVGV